MLFPSPATDRLLYNLDNGLPSLCAYVFSHPNMVEVAGVAGMDAFMADMMFTAHDWDNIAHLIRAARGTGISPLIRVQAFPWATGADRRTVSDAARAPGAGGHRRHRVRRLQGGSAGADGPAGRLAPPDSPAPVQLGRRVSRVQRKDTRRHASGADRGKRRRHPRPGRDSGHRRHPAGSGWRRGT